MCFLEFSHLFCKLLCTFYLIFWLKKIFFSQEISILLNFSKNYNYLSFLNVQCANPTAANLVLEFSIIIFKRSIFFIFSHHFSLHHRKNKLFYTIVLNTIFWRSTRDYVRELNFFLSLEPSRGKLLF